MPVIHTSQENFKKDLGEGLAVLTFSASWCGPCKMLAPVLEELSSETEGINFVKVDVDSNQDLANEFSVMSIPSTFLMKNGEPIAKTMGFMPKEALADWIKDNK